MRNRVGPPLAAPRPCPSASQPRGCSGRKLRDAVPWTWTSFPLRLPRCSRWKIAQLRSQCAHLAAVELDGGTVQPTAAQRDDEGDERGDIRDGADAGDADILAVPFAHRGFALAGALHVGLDAARKTLGIDIARMDAVDLHAVALAEVGERLGEGGDGGIHRTADGKTRRRHAPARAADGDERAAALLEHRPGSAC